MEENNIKTLMDEIRQQNEVERTYLKKQLNMMKALMFAMVGIFLILLVSVGVLVPKVMSTLDNANVALEQISYTAGQMDEVLISVESLVEESSVGVNQALENMNSIDFEKLNGSIEDFNNVISPLSEFFSRFQ
ncbi:MAG: hypothetical protein IKW30_08650 [Lachnospiraceae bacterium]|nr:hypothetical protein [Lachnospiraceae bacterium]